MNSVILTSGFNKEVDIKIYWVYDPQRLYHVANVAPENDDGGQFFFSLPERVHRVRNTILAIVSIQRCPIYLIL